MKLGQYVKDGKRQVMVQITEVNGNQLRGFSSYVCRDISGKLKRILIDWNSDTEKRVVPTEKIWWKQLHSWEFFDEFKVPECCYFELENMTEN